MELDSLSDMDLPDIFEEVRQMDIGASLFSYDLHFKKPPLPARPSPNLHFQKPAYELHFQKPALPPRPRSRSPSPPPRRPVVFEVAPNPNTPFVLDHKKEAEAKALIQEIDGNMGEFAILCGALANAYRGVLTTAPAGLFGQDTVKEAKSLDDETERAIVATAADSEGLWRQILEGFAKYADAEGDPHLAKLRYRMQQEPPEATTKAERKLARAIEREDASPAENPWKRITRLAGEQTGLNPIRILGTKLVPTLAAMRPPPAILTTALNHLPRMTTPTGILEVIRSYVGKYVQFSDASKFYIDAILRVVSPMLFPLLRFMARDSAAALRDANRLLNSPKVAMATVGAATYLFRFIGWLWHVIVAIVHTIVRLIAAIVQFVIAIVVSIYASPVTGIVVNAIVALVIRFVIR